MADVSTSLNVQNLLRTYYKDGVRNLVLRESPVVRNINTLRVEGKEVAMAAVYGAGGAVSGNFTQAKAQSTETVRNAEFKVTPGQLFSVYSMNAKEVQASLTKRGAYMKVAGNKLFAATSALRRTLAASFYGDGYGVIGKMPSSATITAASAVEVTFADPSIPAKLDVGSIVQLKADKTTADANATKAEVIVIDGNKVSLKAASSDIAVTNSTLVQIHGSVDASGNPLLPVGLEAWLPTDRTSLGTTFMNVNRSIAPDRLAGSLIDDSATNTATFKSSIKKAIQAVRRHGSLADLIIMNDEDFAKFSDQIESTNTFFTKTSTKESKKASVGFGEISASFSTNFIENIVDDPYCPKGVAYVLEKDSVEFWSFTNTDFEDNGIVGNNPGKQDVMDFDNEGKANEPSKLLIDDFITVQPGEGDQNGPNVIVTLQCIGTFAVLNPGNCAVIRFFEN